MSKYDLLGHYLKAQAANEVPMTFAEIEHVAGTKLPPSAYRHRPWWSNNASNSAMTKVWLNAGYETSRVDIQARNLVFRRIALEAKGINGRSEAAREFAPAATAGKNHGHSPLFGCMKGTFTIAPGWDLTRPALDPEDLAQWEVSLDRKADLIGQDFSDKRK